MKPKYSNEKNPYQMRPFRRDNYLMPFTRRALFDAYKEGFLAAEKELGWHPISTAPIDRTIEVLDIYGYPSKATWLEKMLQWRIGPPNIGQMHGDFLRQYTHWRELPEIDNK